MGRVRVVTDSTADLSADIARSLDIIVVPLRVVLGQEEYLDGVTLSAEEFMARARLSPQEFAATLPPPVETFESVYAGLAKTTDSIVSLHLSSRLGTTYDNAVEAKERYTIRDICRVTVIDTRLTSLGLGFIAMEAARAAQAGQPLDDVARLARGMLPQTHVLFFVDTVEYLQRSGRIARLETLVSSLINTKPLLRLDDGQIMLMEKVRTRAKALERLFEFVADFPHVEALGIVYGAALNEANNLAKRLENCVPHEKVMITRYGPGLAAHLGPGALGVIVYEGLDVR